MKRRSTPRGRTAALSLAVVGVCVVVLTLKDVAVEQYYLWQLEYGDEEESKLAAQKLAEMGSARAVAVILEQLGKAETSGQFDLVAFSGSDVAPERRFSSVHVSYGLTRVGFTLTWKDLTGSGHRAEVLALDSPTALQPGAPDAASLLAVLQKLEPLLFVYVNPEEAFLVDALWQITEKSGTRCAPHLAGALGETSPYARYVAATFLGATGPPASGARRELAEVLLAPAEPGTLASAARVQAVWALGRIGAGASEAVPALTALLQDEDEGVRRAAAEALRQIESPRRR